MTDSTAGKDAGKAPGRARSELSPLTSSNVSTFLALCFGKFRVNASQPVVRFWKGMSNLFKAVDVIGRDWKFKGNRMFMGGWALGVNVLEVFAGRTGVSFHLGLRGGRVLSHVGVRSRGSLLNVSLAGAFHVH